MTDEASTDELQLERYRALVRRILDGGPPHGVPFDSCRAVVRAEPESRSAFPALCMLLEGALADAALPVEETQLLVPLIKDLARGLVAPGDLV